jgi:hypothetical protein
MTDLDHYLAQHYLNETQLAAACASERDEIDALIGARLIPAPSYVVAAGMVRSHPFGELPAPGATPGRYFPPAQKDWIALTRRALAAGGHDVHVRLKEQFGGRFAVALATLNLTTWRLHDSFRDDGSAIAAGLRARTDAAWEQFLYGTFGLCVANPISEAQIAYKEVLQEKLTQQSENGGRRSFTAQQASEMHALIDAYAAAAMPFSPVEYRLSSRKRLVEDLRAAMDQEREVALR